MNKVKTRTALAMLMAVGIVLWTAGIGFAQTPEYIPTQSGDAPACHIATLLDASATPAQAQLDCLPSASKRVKADGWSLLCKDFPDVVVDEYYVFDSEVLENAQRGDWVAVTESALLVSDIVTVIFDADGNVLSEGDLRDSYISTGQHVALYLDDLEAPGALATVVVKGDVLGTGKMSLSQVVRISSAFSGKNPLKGAYQDAADVAGFDEKITLSDVVMEARLFKQSLRG